MALSRVIKHTLPFSLSTLLKIEVEFLSALETKVIVTE